MRLRAFFGLFFAVLLSAVSLYSAAWLKNPYGRGSELALKAASEYYLYSPSSQAKIVGDVDFAQSIFLTGESTTLVFSSKQTAESYVSGLLQEQGAAIVWEEECLGARSIYAYAPKRGGGIVLSGKPVNLHLVCKDKRVRVGSPIVFGGY